MPIPPDPVLRAATRWLDRLPTSSASRCRALFSTHQEYGDITPTQYEAAYAWLGDTGLLDNPLSTLPTTDRVFEAAILNTPWFADADVLVQRPEEIPDDAARAAAVLGLPEPAAFALIAGSWGKVDTEARERIGASGELALVELLERTPRTRVRHVSLISDGFGYDISAETARSLAHLEVKSTTRRERSIVFLSRNEFETMLRDPAWRLVVVRLSPQTHAIVEIEIADSTWIRKNVPADTGLGRWESCRLDMSGRLKRIDADSLVCD